MILNMYIEAKVRLYSNRNDDEAEEQDIHGWHLSVSDHGNNMFKWKDLGIPIPNNDLPYKIQIELNWKDEIRKC